jgi:Tfp pilus assembly protein PilX
VAADAFIGYRFVTLPTITAVLGVLSLFAASLYLARESMLAVKVIDEEMDHRYATARMRKREQQVDRAEGEGSG